MRAGHLQADGTPDKTLDGMIEKQRGENDATKRASLIADIQRYISSKMYLMMDPGQSLGFTLNWPWLANYGVYRTKLGGSVDQEGHAYWWFDQTKKA